MKSIGVYILLVFVSLSFSLFAEGDAPMEITTDQWTEVSEGIDFTETFKENEEEVENNANTTEFTPPSFNYDLSGFKYLFYFLVVGLVLFVIIKIVMNFNKNPTVKQEKIGIESIEEIEEKMHEIDLDELLKEAIIAKDYRIALRINFLIIIKMLSQKGEISWAKEKTNWEYHLEVKPTNLSLQFKEIIIPFESIWYGEQPLEENQFNALVPSYDRLKKDLTSDE